MRLQEPNWCNLAKARLLNLPEEVYRELFADNSLTNKITANCNQQFAVKIIRQGLGSMLPSEARQLNSLSRPKANIRNVLLLCQGTPVVFARTIMPLGTNNRISLRFAKLGAKSLGSMLYSSNKTYRKPTQISKLSPGNYLFDYIEQNTKVKILKTLYARRNVYTFEGQNLLVNEIYLPSYWHKIRSTNTNPSMFT